MVYFFAILNAVLQMLPVFSDINITPI